MSTEATIELPAPRKRALFNPSSANALPREFTDGPGEVIVANAAVWRALDALDAARSEQGEARGQAEAAPAHDRHAAAAALAAGEDVPGAITPLRRAQFEEAKRKVEAASAAAQRSISVLYDVVDQHYDVLLAGRQAEASAALDAMADFAPTFIERVNTFRSVANVLYELQQWNNNPTHTSLGGTPQRRKRSLETQYEQRVDKVRTHRALRPTYSVQNSIAELLAALTVELEAEAAKVAGTLAPKVTREDEQDTTKRLARRQRLADRPVMPADPWGRS